MTKKSAKSWSLKQITSLLVSGNVGWFLNLREIKLKILILCLVGCFFLCKSSNYKKCLKYC